MKPKLLPLLFFIVLIGIACPVSAQIITTIAGGDSLGLGDGGPATACELSTPYSTAVDASGNLYIADAGNNRVRKVNMVGIITTIAGTGIAGYSGDDSAATNAKLNEPSGVAVDGSGNVYISDNYNHRIRKINTAGIITTYAGTGGFGYNGDGIAATAATLYSPHGIAIDASGNLYICDVLNNLLRKVSTSGIITTIAGTVAGTVYGGDGGAATATYIGQPFGVAVDAGGNVLFADLSFNRICKIDTSGIITTIAGTGTFGYNGDNIIATTAQIKQPFGVAADENGNVYVADYFNSRIRKVNSAGIISTVAGTGVSGYTGDGGLATLSELDGPIGITVNAIGSLYISELNGNHIRYIKNTVSVKVLEEQPLEINIYPNPNNGTFSLLVSANTVVQMNVLVADLMGTEIKKINVTTNKLLNNNLDMPSGIYIIKVSVGDRMYCKKIVVNR